MSAVLIPTSSETEWLQARRQGVTASEIAILMGLSPYSSPYALYHQKLGILPPEDQTAAMERGNVLEPYIADKFREAHPEFDVMGSGRGLYAHSDRPWQMATPDRMLHEHDGDPWSGGESGLDSMRAVLECKVDGGSDEWGDEGSDEIPVHYRCQVLWQMDVMDVAHAHVACLRVRDWRIREYELHLDDDARADLKLMRTEALDFLARINLGDPPDVDWRAATIDALKTLHPSVDDDVTAGIGPQLADWYEAACRNAKRWEKRKRLNEARIREQAGNARRIVRQGPGEIPVARRDVYPVKEHWRKASHVDKFVLTPPKEKKTP
jgi:putative phage-type endonuclease